jgi:hypothetical protein
VETAVNGIIMAYARPFSLVVVLLTVVYMEIMQLKVSEFFIGIATMVVVWFFKSRDEEKQSEQINAQLKEVKKK